MLISRSGAGVARRAHNPKVGSSNLSSATKRNSNAGRRCCFFFDFRMTSNYRPEGSRGNACDRRLVDASYISRAAIFANHRLLIPLRLLIAKGHAPLACSLVNALTTAHCRYQPFARKRIGASYITRAAIFTKSPLTHSAASPHRKRSRSACLFACKRAHDGSLSLPTFCGKTKKQSCYRHPLRDLIKQRYTITDRGR